MYDITQLRQAEFPLTSEHLFFNNAGIAPLAVSVRKEMVDALAQLSVQPAAFFHNVYASLEATLLADLADFIGAAGPDEITLITTTSAGLNAIAQAVDWRPGDNLCFCELEFPSNAYPWLSLTRDGVEVRQVPADNGGLTIAALEGHVDASTRLVAVSAIQFFTGHRTDLGRLGQFCRERGILFVVDAIQAIGHIPIDVAAMQIDVLATGGQKSLLAAPGSGFLYVRRGVCEQLRPRSIGSNSRRDFLHWLDYDITPLPGAARFKSGTANVVGGAGLKASLALLRSLGRENVDRHTRELTALARQLIAGQGYQIITPADDYGPIVTFATSLSVSETDALVAYLAREQITVVRHLDAAGQPHVRLSFHAYNTADELHQFRAALAAHRR